jgi:hypothetical protein
MEVGLLNYANHDGAQRQGMISICAISARQWLYWPTLRFKHSQMAAAAAMTSHEKKFEAETSLYYTMF